MIDNNVSQAQDVRTRSAIQSKMADLDQQMLIEYRNKKKTQRYYRKLVNATRIGKGKLHVLVLYAKYWFCDKCSTA